MTYRIPRAIIVAIALCFCAPLHADVLLDQEHDNTGSGVANSTNGNVSEVGQTFTVGISGTLDHIDVLMFRLGGIFDPTGDPVLKVYNTSGGMPIGGPLATVSVPEAIVPFNFASFVTFDISAAAIAVNANDVLAFSISTSSSVGPYFLLVDGDTGLPSDYADGDAVSRVLNLPPDPWALLLPLQDHGFRTWVDGVAPVPEPAGAAICLAVCAGLIGTSRRRKS